MGKVDAVYRRRFFSLWAIFLLAALGLSYSFVGAHGSEASFEKVIGDVHVDIGYTPELFREDAVSIFDFAILDGDSESLQYSDIWVRIEHEGATVFASGIHKPVLGKTLLSYAFPQSGDYELFARFQDGRESLVETSFPFTVEPSDNNESSSWKFLVTLLGGLVIGIVGSRFARSR